MEQHGFGSSEPEPLDRSHRHFGQADAREYVMLTSGIALYAHDAGIESIVLVDKAARPAYVGLLHAWRAFYPDEPRPLVCFMNPLGVQPSDQLAPVRRARGTDEVTAAGVDLRIEPRSEAEVADEFEQTYRELLRRRDLPLLVVDTCLHSGESVRPVLDRLHASGFADVRLGVADYQPYGRTPTGLPDVVFGGEATAGNCYPFGYRDRLVTKTFDHVTSRSSQHPAHRREGRELRVEAREIIAEGLRLIGAVALEAHGQAANQ